MSVGATTRRRGSSGLILLALTLPTCFDLQKVSPGPRYIDDFEDGGLTPSWPRFQEWTCDTDGGPSPPDGGQPADVDGGQSARCGVGVEDGGDRDHHGLRVDFQLGAPLAGDPQPLAEAVTRTTAGTVDITSFKVLMFSAFLESTALPSGTLLQVAFGCSATQNHSSPFLTVPYLTFRVKYPDDQFSLMLGTTVETRTCLSQVDSIRFVVKPEAPNGMSAGGAGTLHLDNISLEN